MAETATQSAAPQVVLQQYEGMFLFGAAAAQEPQNAINTVRGMIEKHGGQVLVLPPDAGYGVVAEPLSSVGI